MPLFSLLSKNVLGKYWVTSELTPGCLIENEVTVDRWSDARSLLGMQLDTSN